MEFQSSLEQVPQKITHNQQTLSNSKRHKKKNIKKERMSRGSMHLRGQMETQRTIVDFVDEQGGQYFELMERESKEKVCKSFKSAVHVRDILGAQNNVFGLNNFEQTSKHSQKYLNMIKRVKRGGTKLFKLTNNNKDKCFKVASLLSYGQNDVKIDHSQTLEWSQYELLSKRGQMLAEVNQFMSNVSSARPQLQINQFQLEMLALCKINKEYQKELSNKIENIVAEDQSQLYDLHNRYCLETLIVQERYIQELIKKNLRLAFEEKPMNYLTYFSDRQLIELQPQDSESSIRMPKNTDQLIKYLKYKKTTKGKQQKSSLKTCCSGCFSDLYEIYNPIQRCGECGMRMHKLCHDIRRKCQKCKYQKKAKTQRNSKVYCFICDSPKMHGLSLEILKEGKDQFYAHTFCLFSNRFWKIEDRELIFDVQNPQLGSQICKICQRRGLCLISQCCGAKVHGLCSFLQGYSFSLKENANVSIRCCRSQQSKKKVSFDRQFRLNVNKLLYKNIDEVVKVIQEN